MKGQARSEGSDLSRALTGLRTTESVGSPVSQALSDPLTHTFTFLFTDIEGSTRRWETAGEAMSVALARHDALLRQAIEGAGGRVFKTMGDAFCAVFEDPVGALAAALDAQRALSAEAWGAFGEDFAALRVRIALHIGVAERREGDYYGPTLNRVARLLAAGHGGQVLLSQAAADWIKERLPQEAALRDLGDHRLKDLARPERIYQLAAPGLVADLPALNTLERYRTNLAVQTSSFIGRAAELRELRRLVAERRLITLTGVGGTGKTRLAQQLAAEVLDSYGDGAWLVELAPLTDPTGVAQALALSFGLAEESGRPLEATLAEYLRRRQLLLVLDNCEHLVEPVARLAELLLARAPGLTLLATSREALGLPGELVYALEPLSTPKRPVSGGRPLEPADIEPFEAVQLFIDRAAAARTGFAVDGTNAPAIAEICQRLDGIPLAIELAAVRLRSMPVGELAQRLDQRFRLLTGGSRSALPRQQTLQATIDWSHDLLSPTEQALFRRLTVFHGAWSLEAAESICAVDGLEPWEVTDLLGRLVEKSLVTLDADERPRYRMLETVRQYAADKLAADPDWEALRDGHAGYFLAFEPSAIREWPELLAADRDNFLAAIDWGATRPSLAAAALQLLITGGWGAWGWGTTIRQAFERLERLTSAAGDVVPPIILVEAYRQLGGHADGAGADPDAVAASYFQRCAAAAQKAGDPVLESWAYNDHGNYLMAKGRPPEAKEALERALALKRQVALKPDVAITLSNLGELALNMNDPEGAETLFREALALHRLEDPIKDLAVGGGNLHFALILPLPLEGLGRIALRRNELSQAAEYFSDGLAHLRRLGDVLASAPWQGAVVETLLPGIALVAGAMGQPWTAARWLASAERWLERDEERKGVEHGSPRWHDRERIALQEAGDAAAWQEAWAAGRSLPLEEAVAEALLRFPPPVPVN